MSKRAKYTRKYYLKNRAKILNNVKEWARNNLHKAKNVQFKRKYGITFEHYINIFNLQKGLCAVCCKPEERLARNGQPKYLSLDHCHKSLKIRGLLCYKCNTGLGLFKDSIDNLKQAVHYMNEVEKVDYGYIRIK